MQRELAALNVLFRAIVVDQTFGEFLSRMATIQPVAQAILRHSKMDKMDMILNYSDWRRQANRAAQEKLLHRVHPRMGSGDRVLVRVPKAIQQGNRTRRTCV
jgi:hypothetical protein